MNLGTDVLCSASLIWRGAGWLAIVQPRNFGLKSGLHSAVNATVWQSLGLLSRAVTVLRLVSFGLGFLSNHEDLFLLCPSSQNLTDAIARAAADALQNTMQSAYREAFQSVVLPAFEKSCQSMFQQINDTFKQGTQECESGGSSPLQLLSILPVGILTGSLFL